MEQMKVRAVLLLVATLMAAACGEKPTEPKAEEAPPKPATGEERVKWYQDCWKEFNEKRWDVFRKCYAENATSKQIGYGAQGAAGPDAILRGSEDFAKSFPDGRGDGQLILVSGNKIAGIFILKGSNNGPLKGPDGKETPATNRKFGVLFGHYIETTPATTLQVTNEVGIMNGAAMAYQLGLSKEPARPVMDKGEAAAKVVIARNDETETKNVEAERASLDAFNRHDSAAADAVIADDYVLHDQSVPKDMNKKENSAMTAQFWKAFSDAKLNTDTILAAGDYVAVVGTFEGTNDGDMASMKLKKTGKKVALPFIGVDRFEGGKIKESWLIFDAGLMASQLGMN